MTEQAVSEGNTTKLSNEKLETILDAVDVRTVHQEQIHNHLADGFMALARERYRDPSSLERLGHLVYDNREDLKSDVVLVVEEGDTTGCLSMSKRNSEEYTESSKHASITDEGLRRRNPGEATKQTENTPAKKANAEFKNNFVAIPSGELRQAIQHFRRAVDQAIEVVNATNKIGILLDQVTET